MVLLQNLNSLTYSINGGINLVDSFKNSSMMVNLIMIVLIVFSIVSWGLIAYKFVQYRKAMIETEKFVSIFWKNISHEEIFTKAGKMKDSPVAMVFSAGFNEFKETKKTWEDRGIAVVGSKVDELAQNVERTMRRESQSRIQLLESRLQFLATTASASPFLGLLGTVYGIMNAFQEIAKTGSATLGSISPHLSEALVTTAFGLIAAIPATVFYNYYLSLLSKFENEAASITSDFINQIKRSNV